MLRKLRGAIGAEGQALLDHFNLLKPLIEKMVASEAIADVVVSAEQLEQARLCLLQERGFDGMEQWEELLNALGCTEAEIFERMRQSIRRRSLISERYAAKAETLFLERKNELDQVV